MNKPNYCIITPVHKESRDLILVEKRKPAQDLQCLLVNYDIKK